MPEAQLDVVINSIANTTGFATAKAEMAGLSLQTGQGFSPNFGGPLSSRESSYATSQLKSLEAQTVANTVVSKELSSAERDLASEGNAVARAASSMGVAGAEAGGRLAALGGVMSSSGVLGLGIGASIIALGGLAMATKSIIDDYDQQQSALGNLTQGVEAYNRQLGQNTAAHTRYIQGSQHAKVTAEEFRREQDAVTIALNAEKIAQLDYEEVLKKHSATSDQAEKAAMRLQDAEVRLSEAQRKLSADTGETNARFVTIAATHAKHAIALADEEAAVSKWIDTNNKFLPSMYEAETAYARLARAGFDLTMQTRLMNDALDLSVAKGISLDQAVTILASSSTGFAKGLRDLGFSQKDVNDALGKGATEGDKFKELLKLLEPKIKDAHKGLSDSATSSNHLNYEWDQLANHHGKDLEGMLDAVKIKLGDAVGKLGDFLDMLSNSDKGSNSPWAAFQNGLIATISLLEVLNQEFDNLLWNANAWDSRRPNKNLGAPGSSGRGRVGSSSTLTSQ